MFELTSEELDLVVSQFVIPDKKIFGGELLDEDKSAIGEMRQSEFVFAKTKSPNLHEFGEERN